jgi:hypothetical protein
MKTTSFKAPWGAPLALMTAVCAAICLSIGVLGLMLSLGNAAALRFVGLSSMKPPWAGWLLVAVPFVTLAASAAFMVRGYVLADTSLIIKRLGWESRVDLSGLNSANLDPDALQRSLRLFGNGGFFSLTGWFRSPTLGIYRAYATDTRRAVVLRFADKTVVVTPDDPQRFAAEINPQKT